VAEAADGRRDCSQLHAFSVDNASTRDIDDALSVEIAPDRTRPSLSRSLALSLA
jgi:exoribonuclease R